MSGNVPHPAEVNPIRLNRSIRDLFEGRSNAFGTFTCVEDTGTTTVSHPNVGTESVILLFPQTAAAAAEVAGGTIYVAAATITPGQFIVTHANDPSTTRTFAYAIVG